MASKTRTALALALLAGAVVGGSTVRLVGDREATIDSTLALEVSRTLFLMESVDSQLTLILTQPSERPEIHVYVVRGDTIAEADATTEKKWRWRFYKPAPERK